MMPAWMSRVGILGALGLSPGDSQPVALGPCWPFGAGPQRAGGFDEGPALMRALTLTLNTLSCRLTFGLKTAFSTCM